MTTPSPRKKLSDILNGSGGDIDDVWRHTEAAGDDKPLPPGDYICHAVAGDLKSSRTNHTPGYSLSFQVIEGEHAGRRVWHDLWLTPAAMPRTKRDLAKLGITELKQLEQPLPAGLRCRVRVTIRKDDGGADFNHVQRFELLGIDEPQANPFAPDSAGTDDDGQDIAV